MRIIYRNSFNLTGRLTSGADIGYGEERTLCTGSQNIEHKLDYL